MPEVDGIAALKKIKGSDPNAKIIMCSAMGQQAMVIEAIQRNPSGDKISHCQNKHEQDEYGYELNITVFPASDH